MRKPRGEKEQNIPMVFILTIYELQDDGIFIEFQQCADNEMTLQASAVQWAQGHLSDHFDEGMFHDAPSDSVEDNYQAILLWSQYADNAGGLRFIIRAADA
jgi:hypothetical protein